MEGRTEVKMLKTFNLLALIILTFSLNTLFIYGQGKVVHPIKPKDFDGLGMTNDFKVLAEGSQSNVDKPFVFVARDEKSYAQLQKLVEGLPSYSTIDFKKNAVVAGFAGERPTGGWTVEIRKVGKKVLIDLQSPRKDMMVTQVITTTYKVSLIPVNENESLSLNFTESYAKDKKTFQLKKGDFEYTGGIAGIRKKIQATGTVQMLTFGDYVTMFFDLKGKGKDQKLKLSEISSGTLNEGSIDISRLDSGTFVQFPRPPFFVQGTLKNKNLSLKFESQEETKYADGFTGKGSLDAIQVK